MDSPNPKIAELDQLLWQMRDGAIDDDGLTRIETLVTGDAEVRRFYIRYSTLCGGLRWLNAGEAGDEGRGTRDEGRGMAGSPAIDASVGAAVEHPVGTAVELPSGQWSQTPNPEPPFPTLSTTNYPPPTAPFVGSWAFSYMVATVVMGVAILGFWAYKITHHQHIAKVPSQSAPSDARPEMVFVGRITGMVDVKWSDDPRYLPPPGYAHVSLGRKYKLDAGLLEITYDSGAKIILQGPCTYEVESTAGGYLSLGKLTARVEARDEGRGASAKPQAANQKSPASFILHPSSLIPHPSSLFSVRTPTAVVTDLGTEFGVEVSDEGTTTSHVFRGSVKVEVVGDSLPSPSGRGAGGEGSGQVVVLQTNESVRVEKGEEAGSVRLVLLKEVDNPPKFVRRLVRPPKVLGSLGTVDGSIFHDDFDGDAIDADKWTASTKSKTPASKGTISVTEGHATFCTHSREDSEILESRSGQLLDTPGRMKVAVLKSKPGRLDFSASPDDWWAEIRFQLTGNLDAPNWSPECRTWAILSGEVDDYVLSVFDLRGMQRGSIGSPEFDLGWFGNDNSGDLYGSPPGNGMRVAEKLCGRLKKGQFYTITIHRKSDGMIDIYLDGELIATKPMIGEVNPVYLRTGDMMPWNISGTSLVDYVKVGALVPALPDSGKKSGGGSLRP